MRHARRRQLNPVYIRQIEEGESRADASSDDDLPIGRGIERVADISLRSLESPRISRSLQRYLIS